MDISGFNNTPHHEDASIADTSRHAPADDPSQSGAPSTAEVQQGDASEAGIVPQLDIADFAPMELAPYAPTGAHPYDAFPESSVGSQGKLPPDLLNVCRAAADTAALDSVIPPHASLLALVEQAWADDVDNVHVVRMLEAIEAMPLPLRPEALRAVGSMLLVEPKFPAGVAPTDSAWAEAITRTRELVYQKIDPNAQLQMLVDLDVAAWHVLDPKSRATGGQHKADCWQRMQDMPPACWPPLLDAAVFRSGDLKWLDIKAILRDESIRFPAVSDRVAVALARLPESHSVTMQMLEVMRTRLGLTDNQYERLLRPMEAERVGEIHRKLDLDFSAFWVTFPVADPILRDMTERVALKEAFQQFLKTGSTPAQHDLGVKQESGDVADSAETVRWNSKFLDFFSTVESAACRSVASAGQSDVSAQSLMDAVSTIVQKMKNRENFEGCLNEVFKQPLGFQPVLLDRLAEALPADYRNAALLPLLAPISEWRANAVEMFTSQNDPVSAVRACVAELRAYMHIAPGNAEVVGPIFDTVTRQVFETMPSESWGTMLSYLDDIAAGSGKAPWIQAEALDRARATFLKNPDATMHEMQHKDYVPVCFDAGVIFNELPDRDTETASKFDNFCERLGLPMRGSASVKTWVLYGIGQGVPTRTPHLRATARAELEKVGFNDPESLRSLLFAKRR
jgi:hypothetical protein